MTRKKDKEIKDIKEIAERLKRYRALYFSIREAAGITPSEWISSEEDAESVINRIGQWREAIPKWKEAYEKQAKELTALKRKIRQAKITAQRNDDGSITVVDTRNDEEAVYAFATMDDALTAADFDLLFQRSVRTCCGWSEPEMIEGGIRVDHECGWSYRAKLNKLMQYPCPPEECPRCAALVEGEKS